MDEDSKRRELLNTPCSFTERAAIDCSETVKMDEYHEHIEMDAETVALFGNFEDEQCTAPLDAFASAIGETLETGAAVSASEHVEVEYAGTQDSHQTIVIYFEQYTVHCDDGGTRVTTLDEIETAIMAAREL